LKEEGMSAFEPFRNRRTALLTTYKRDGTPVGTPVTVVVDGDRAFVRTYDRSWKARRMRRNPRVEVAPSTVRGKPRGEAVAATARLLSGTEAERAARLIARRQRVLQGILVPWFHRVKGYRTLHYELVPIAEGAAAPAARAA
jgi:PPOX class probable F420-dependent enzyme